MVSRWELELGAFNSTRAALSPCVSQPGLKTAARWPQRLENVKLNAAQVGTQVLRATCQRRHHEAVRQPFG